MIMRYKRNSFLFVRVVQWKHEYDLRASMQKQEFQCLVHISLKLEEKVTYYLILNENWTEI